MSTKAWPVTKRMVIDIICLMMGAYGFYIGFSRGIIRTIFTVLSLIFGLLAAFKLGPATTRFLETATGSHNPMMFIAGFLMAFFATMIFIRTISKFLERGLQSANINVLNQLLGGVLLGGVMVLLFSMLLWFADQSRLIDPTTKDQSATYLFLKNYPDKVWAVVQYFKPAVQDFWEESVEFLDRMQEQGIERSEDDPSIFDIPDDDSPPRRR